ncbi:GNAT family N-acetyltransferase [Lacibacter sediminis]|uniref:GNAT family N-acetyltransferase n=1 Tax=Lacibacter sediminis TaxID=2760713 RepID=A0A7G5XE09_9BACT|nr:GNAT family N-acetyltransferase [Lacibacter sediminis]QNA43712.1 GNAT family N-acetyltransferase [Lacibacter sediminis]
MISYSTSTTKQELEGILKLQQLNLAQGLMPDEIQSQGFVTVKHTYDVLKKMNDLEKHVIAKDDEKVIGYVLAMTKESRFDISVLIPMFDVFDQIIYKEKIISDLKYIIVGQVCVDKAYRGQGIFDNCYAAYKEFYSSKYDLVLTEIASSNTRSLQAHKRIGFREIHSYIDPAHTEWIVVVWDWRNDQ